MDFYIIGTGNIAWFLGKRLVSAGHACQGVYGRNKDRTSSLAKSINTNILTQFNEIQHNADLIIIAVTDSAILEIVNKLKATDSILIHTAGAVERGILDGAVRENGVFWPIYSIAKDTLPEHRNIPVVIESNSKKAHKVLTELAECVTDIYKEVSWQQRQWLHLCAVISNNFSNHLFAITEELCEQQNIPTELLHPIIEQTTTRIKEASARLSQTGPAKRGDKNTIEKQLKMLDQYKEWQKLYEVITTSIEKMYSKEGYKS